MPLTHQVFLNNVQHFFSVRKWPLFCILASIPPYIWKEARQLQEQLASINSVLLKRCAVEGPPARLATRPLPSQPRTA